MKYSGKIMSACALLVAVVGCHGAEVGQKVTFYVKNQTRFPIYGGIYITNVGGRAQFTNATRYHTLGAGACTAITINKSLKATEFNRLIFSANPRSLRQKIQYHKRPSDVTISLIPQKIFEQTADKECYFISGTQKKLNIRRLESTDGCAGCSGSSFSDLIVDIDLSE